MHPRIGLALSGGGSKGAFTVGALKVIRQKFGVDMFPVISGTSTGSLIGTLLATNDFTTLVDIYRNVKTENIVNPHHSLVAGVFGTEAVLFAAAILGGRAVFDSSALAATIHANVDFAAVKAAFPDTLLVYNTVDLGSGESMTFDNRQHSAAQLEKAVLASANIPVLTDPVEIKAGGAVHQFVDGGVREFLPLGAVFSSGVEVDAIIAIATSPMGAKPHDAPYDKITEILARTIDILDAEVAKGDYVGTQQMNAMLRMIENAKGAGVPANALLAGIPDDVRASLGGKRDVRVILIAPDKHIDVDSLTFDPATMREVMDQGFQTAKKLLADVEI
jgi:NTE family protein